MDIDIIQSKRGGGKDAFVFVGGSGDTKEDFQQIAQLTARQLPSYNICTFTFRKVKNKQKLFRQQVQDLENVVGNLINKNNIKSVVIFCTSLGAYSTCYLLKNKKFANYIKEVIFFDPANFYTSWRGPDAANSWTGSEDYNPDAKTCSDLLVDIDPNKRVHVVHLTLKNYGKEGYLSDDHAERGKNFPNGFTRLNTEMVKDFYLKVPEKNKGKYIENNSIPHAFLRDGNVQKNRKEVMRLILKCLRE